MAKTLRPKKKLVDRPMLTQYFNELADGYILLFAYKHEIEFTAWVDNRIGGMAEFGNSLLDFIDIKFDIDTEQSREVFFDWFFASDFISYPNFIKNNEGSKTPNLPSS